MEPKRVCLECGDELTETASGSIVGRLYCDECASMDIGQSLMRAILSTAGFALLAVIIAAIVAFMFAPPSLMAADLPRWAAVKWERGVPLMADYGVPQSKGECEVFVGRRNAAYSHAGVSARWTCRDMWADLGRET